MGKLATTAEKGAREGKMKQPYNTTKKLAGRYSKRASRSIQGDLGRGTSANGLKRRISHQDTKERRSEQM